MGKLRIGLVVTVAALALAQLVPVERTNPPVEAQVPTSPSVRAALEKACWDCHSNETVWGWHTRIAPISWLVAHDVKEGREELNFSRWNAVDEKRIQALTRKIPEEVQDGDMPPLLYTLAHPSARLTAAEKLTIAEWARSLRTNAPPRSSPARGEPPAHGRDDD